MKKKKIFALNSACLSSVNGTEWCWGQWLGNTGKLQEKDVTPWHAPSTVLSSQGLEDKVLWDRKRVKPHNYVLKKIPCTTHKEIWVFWATVNWYFVILTTPTKYQHKYSPIRLPRQSSFSSQTLSNCPILAISAWCWAKASCRNSRDGKHRLSRLQTGVLLLSRPCLLSAGLG